jgi:hypothetical protein
MEMMRTGGRAVAVALGFLLGPRAEAQELEAELLDGGRASGRFVAFGPEGLTFASGDAEKNLVLDALISFGFEGAPPTPAAELAEVELANGVRWIGHLRGGRGEDLLLGFGARGELPLPYGEYRRVEILSRTAGRGALLPPPEGSDRIYRVVGDALDVVDGIVTGYDESGIAIEDAAGRERRIGWKETAALLFGGAEATWTLGERSATLLLRDGSAVRGSLAPAPRGVLALALGEGQRLELAPGEVWSVELHGPGFVRLGELDPAAVEKVPFFADGPAPYYLTDRGLLGGPLRIGGKGFARGLALRPICDLRYELGGAYRGFRGRVGIDDACEPERHRDETWYGTVRFRIEVDGREVWASPVVRAGQPALAIPPLDLSGARSLVLRTDFADGLPAGDLPVWIAPILLR